MATHQVRVDYTKSLVEEPETGHNRWHPDIAPLVTCDPGDEVVLDTRDAFDGRWARTRPLRRSPGPT
jgi:formamidase